MKRLCTKEEKRLLYKNRKQMLKGIFQTASDSKSAPLIMSAVISVILTIALLSVFEERIGINNEGIELGMKLFMIALIFPLKIAISRMMYVFRANKQAKKYTKQKNIMINGVTIVAVDTSDRFSYIEDDVLNEDGRPIVIDYPSCAYDIMPEDIGKRMIILYSADTDFQLVKLNDELRGMISNYALVPTDVLERGIRVPHPSVLKIDKDGHSLSDEEKESFANRYVKMVQKAALQKAKIYSIIIFVCVIIISVVISINEEYPLWKILPFGMACFAGLAVFYWLLTLIKRVNSKRKAKFIYAKEVVFHSYIIHNKVAIIKVYEWNRGNVMLYEYPAGNVSAKTTYGSVLFKLTHCKEGVVLLSQEPV